MPWPKSTDYIEAVQNLDRSMSDEELRGGKVAVTPLGLPMAWAGGFADVYQIHNARTGNTWALKCFTKKVTDQADRYRHISTHLDRARLPFMVNFKYLDQGIRVQGEWYPALKMRWVEGGIRLNEFVEQYLDRPRTLRELLRIWVKMADRLRRAAIGHCDLQHGNVLLVPQDSGSLALRLIDYDGIHVPALAGKRSPELGHPAFQHPQRSKEGVYSPEVDRFSHLVIYSAIQGLTVGRETLWKRFNNDENLLFREEDFRSPGRSEVFRSLWKLPDADTRVLVGRLALACQKPLERTPLLDEIPPLTSAEEQELESLLSGTSTLQPAAVVEPSKTGSVSTLPEWMQPESVDVPLAELLPETTREDRSPWRLPLAFFRLLDWPLKKIAGEENEILHNFLRSMAAVVLAISLIVGVRMVPQWIENAGHSATDTEVADSLSAEVTTPPDPADSPPAATDLPEDFTNAIGIQFKLLPAGEFMMGSPNDDPDKDSDETPQHRVQITKPFYLGIYEVTQQQYEKVMGKNPSEFKGPSQPVEKISWEDATEFCRKLSEMDGKNDYRLPTEAEWEYACRAGTSTRYSCGDKLDPAFAWFSDNSDRQTHPVGEKRPNDWGLYDMHGNVWEWCQDRYADAYYKSSPPDDPAGPSTDSLRVFRGGGWNDGAGGCRSAIRGWFRPGPRGGILGFRVALVPVESAAPPEDTMPPPEPETEPPLASAIPEPVADLPEERTNAIGMKFKLIPAGEFMMGSPDSDPDKEDDETPQHRVRITKPFYLGVYEVTQEQYEKVMGETPSRFEGPSNPVEQVSWEDAAEFCGKLSEVDADCDYRLPTEAEWEYACRAGTTTRFSCGNGLGPEHAWSLKNSAQQTHPVGETRPNAWGLYDMHGNVWEWCQFRYDGDFYGRSPLDDPQGPMIGSRRVTRGGGYDNSARNCRAANRGRPRPTWKCHDLGFRVVLAPAK